MGHNEMLDWSVDCETIDRLQTGGRMYTKVEYLKYLECFVDK